MGRHRRFYTTSEIDRAAARRRDDSWVRDRLVAPEARFVPVRGVQNLIARGDGPRAAILDAAGLRDLTGLRPERLATAGAEAASIPPVLLGLCNDAAHFAVAVPDDASDPRGEGRARYGDLRRHGPAMDASEAGLLAYARAMVHWHRTHRFCGCCGAPTRVREAGHLRVCPDDGCGETHFPRTNPAIIVQVVHDDRILLGRQASWPEDWRSVLAGFVEPGESLEGAVRREVLEEAGVALDGVRYFGSQPWPFPASLMLGFVATAVDDRLAPGDEELAEVGWWRRRDLRHAHQAGAVRLPPGTSISRQLIDAWLEPS